MEIGGGKLVSDAYLVAQYDALELFKELPRGTKIWWNEPTSGWSKVKEPHWVVSLPGNTKDGEYPAYDEHCHGSVDVVVAISQVWYAVFAPEFFEQAASGGVEGGGDG